MEKQFIGRAKTIKTQFGDLVKLSFSPDDLKKVSESGWLNVVLKNGKQGYYMELDTWKPDPIKKASNNEETFNPSDGMPF